MYGELPKILPQRCIYWNEPLKKHTSFKIGGPADVLVTPQTEEQLRSLLSYIKCSGSRFFVIGNGSNTLFSDSGFRGIVIQLSSEFQGIEVRKQEGRILLRARAGTQLGRLAKAACENHLAGLEFAAGIPGSVGGAILMNAGAYDGEMSKVVSGSTYLNLSNLTIHCRSGAEHLFSYRHSVYQEENSIILSGDFLLTPADKKDIVCKMKEFASRRSEKQPLNYPSAGSAFKRPPGNYAGKLIEECGLRGYRCGGAMVSEKHCGFIINYDHATCEDVLHVIEYVKKVVFEQKGVMLETEIRIIEG